MAFAGKESKAVYLPMKTPIGIHHSCSFYITSHGSSDAIQHMHTHVHACKHAHMHACAHTHTQVGSSGPLPRWWTSRAVYHPLAVIELWAAHGDSLWDDLGRTRVSPVTLSHPRGLLLPLAQTRRDPTKVWLSPRSPR